MPERTDTTGVLEIIPRNLSFIARIGMQTIILFYVLSEPSKAVEPLAGWVLPLAIGLVAVLYLLTLLSTFTPFERHRLHIAFALTGLGAMNGLVLLFAFDGSQALLLMTIMALFESTQLMPRSWVYSLTSITALTSLTASLSLGPADGVTPHVAEIAIRVSFCIGLMVVMDSVFREMLDERRKLHDSEGLFRITFDRAPTGMAIARVEDGRLTKVNEAYREMLGYTEAELVGREISSLTIEEDFKAQRARMDAVAGGADDGYRMTKRYRRKDGAIVTGDVATSLVQDATGAAQWIAQITDVTASLAAESRRHEAEARYRALAESFPDGAVFVFDSDDRAILTAGQELEAFGMEPADGDGLPQLPERLMSEMRPWLAEAFTGREHHAELSILDRAFECRTVPMLDVDGHPMAALVVAIDITERRDLEARIVDSNTELKHAVTNMQLRNAEAKTLSEIGELLGACAEEAEAHQILGRMVPRLFPGTSGAIYLMRSSKNLLEMVASWGDMPPDESSVQPEACWALRRSRAHVVDDVAREVTCPHVTPMPGMSYSCVPMLAQGDTLGLLHVRSSPSSMGEKKERNTLLPSVAEQLGLSLANFRLRETLRAQSIQDPLTGLYNRRFMTEFLDRQLHRAQRQDQSLSVLMIDVDHLKATNDTFGHEAGDRLLEDVARVLVGGIRGGDVACRYGGDEFTVVATDADLEQAEVLAERLRASFRALDVGRSMDVESRPGLSIGIAAARDHGWSAEGLLRAADQALYRAKADGRGRTTVAV